jgi:transcriptional regulator with XRE-family HTH domain
MLIDRKKLGRAIADIRKRSGLKQKEVAERTGLTVNYLSLVENGERGVSLETLNRLAETFGIPAECLVFLGGKGAASIKGGAAMAKLCETTTMAIRQAVGLDDSSKL